MTLYFSSVLNVKMSKIILRQLMQV